MNSERHILSAFDRDLETVQALVVKMGGMVESAIHDSALALESRDEEKSDEVRRRDKAIDALEMQINEEAARLIALRAPRATDLRMVLSVIKISHILERVGDYAKNIAKRTPLIHASDGERIEAISLLPAMAQMAGDMVHDVLDAFSARDAEAAIRVSERDARLDDFYDSIFRTLVTYMVENPRTISEVAHLLFVAKNIERIGDHATNVAEMVYFAATGQYLADRDTDTAEN